VAARPGGAPRLETSLAAAPASATTQLDGPITVNIALEAAVVGLLALTAALGTGLALRALPRTMPAGLRRLAEYAGAALGAGLGSVLVAGVLVAGAGLGSVRTVVLEIVLAATLVAMVAEHAALSRRLRTRWLCTPGAELPVPVVLLPLLREVPARVLRAAGR
jgi:hypothetical protein